MNLTAVRKSVVNVISMLVTATPLILHVLDQAPFQGTNTALVVTGILGLLGAVTHYQVPNTTTDPAVAATQSVKLVTPPLPGTKQAA